jgi:hypothetical protein
MNAVVTSIAAEPSSSIAATYAPLATACAAHGISRNTAYRLMRDGLLDTFTIRSRRYVYLESLRTLPERLVAREAA